MKIVRKRFSFFWVQPEGLFLENKADYTGLFVHRAKSTHIEIEYEIIGRNKLNEEDWKGLNLIAVLRYMKCADK